MYDFTKDMPPEQPEPKVPDVAELHRLLNKSFGLESPVPVDQGAKAGKDKLDGPFSDEIVSAIIATLWSDIDPDAASYELVDEGVKVTKGEVSLTLAPIDAILLAGRIYGLTKDSKHFRLLFRAAMTIAAAELTAGRMKQMLERATPAPKKDEE